MKHGHAPGFTLSGDATTAAAEMPRRLVSVVTRRGVIQDKDTDANGHWLLVRWDAGPSSWMHVSPERYAQASVDAECEYHEDQLEPARRPA